MTIVLLVRHAAYDSGRDHLAGRSNCALSNFGQAQARALSRNVFPTHFTCLQSSPRLRCRQTLEPFATEAQRPISFCPELDEIDFGDWAGKSFEQLETDPLWRHWNEQRSHARPPGGETMAEAQSRILAHLAQTSNAHPAGTIIVATHAELIRAVILHCLALTLDAWESIDVAYASVTTIAIGRSGQMFVDQKVAA